MFQQDIYEGTTTFFDVIKKAMYTKMHLIRYYYTEMTRLSMDGGAFYKPLFFEFDQDEGALNAQQEENIMLGKAMKLSINSNTLGKNATDFYFPPGETWCSLLQSNLTDTCFTTAAGAGEIRNLPTKASDYYLHLRGGYIVPMQEGTTLGEKEGVRTTTDLQDHPVDFHINADCSEGADCNA